MITLNAVTRRGKMRRLRDSNPMISCFSNKFDSVAFGEYECSSLLDSLKYWGCTVCDIVVMSDVALA